jgi:hypothetical protein
MAQMAGGNADGEVNISDAIPFGAHLPSRVAGWRG